MQKTNPILNYIKCPQCGYEKLLNNAITEQDKKCLKCASDIELKSFNANLISTWDELRIINKQVLDISLNFHKLHEIESSKYIYVGDAHNRRDFPKTLPLTMDAIEYLGLLGDYEHLGFTFMHEQIYPKYMEIKNPELSE